MGTHDWRQETGMFISLYSSRPARQTPKQSKRILKPDLVKAVSSSLDHHNPFEEIQLAEKSSQNDRFPYIEVPYFHFGNGGVRISKTQGLILPIVRAAILLLVSIAALFTGSFSSIVFFNMITADSGITLRTRKFMTNRLLSRRQMALEVLHPGLDGVSKAKMMEYIGKMYKVDPKQVVCFGFKNIFGGGRSTGFALIYDSMEALKKFEPKHRQARSGIITLTANKTSRKMRKEKKNRAKKVRGKEKNKPQTKSK